MSFENFRCYFLCRIKVIYLFWKINEGNCFSMESCFSETENNYATYYGEDIILIHSLEPEKYVANNLDHSFN